MENDELKGLRHRFFEGELPMREIPKEPTRRSCSRRPLTAAGMLGRVDGRLRRVVVKSCTNSYAAAKVVETFESFLVATFGGENKMDTTLSLEEEWWRSLLLQEPTVTHQKEDNDNNKIVARFLFDAPSSNSNNNRKGNKDAEAAAIAAKGGFHRILLHAVCQFHGLRAVSNMMDIDELPPEGSTSTRKSARALTVTGSIGAIDTEFRLLESIVPSDSQNNDSNVTGVMDEKWDLCSETSWTVV